MNEKDPAKVQRSSNTTKIWSFCMRINLIVLLKSTTIMLMVVAVVVVVSSLFCRPTWILVHDCTSYNYNEWLLRFPFSFAHLQVCGKYGGIRVCVLNFCACANVYDVQQAIQSKKKSEREKKQSNARKSARWMVSWIAVVNGSSTHSTSYRNKKKAANKRTHMYATEDEVKKSHNRMKIRKMQPREINTIKTNRLTGKTGQASEPEREREIERNARTNIKYITQCPPCLRHANSKLWLISDQLNWIMILFFFFLCALSLL